MSEKMEERSNETKNCHYISRFLTKPWEQEDRRLWYYDFDECKFLRSSSKRLFAADSINSPEVEEWLGVTVETPLAQARPRLVAGAASALDDWRFRRAAILMLWLQGVRSKSVQAHSDGQGMEWLAALSEAELDTMATLFMEDYAFYIVHTVGKEGMIAPLFFPSSGIFPMMVPDAGCLSRHSVALAMPLDLDCALVAVPSGSTVDMSRVPASLSNCSVGAGTARKVLLCPGLEREDKLREDLTVLRSRAIAWLGTVAESRSVIAEMFGEIGLEPNVDQAGRLRKP